MPQVSTESRSIDHRELTRLAARLLIARDLIPADAELMAQMLVEANLRGVDSHGVARLPHYLSRIEHGSINPRPNMTVSRLGASAARLDGDHGLGHLVMHRAAGEVIELARESGAGWVAVQESSHCGALAYYGQRIAEAGMIGLVFSHVDSMVLPHGAKQPFCGTNPICITAPRDARGAPPGESRAVCLDMATSIVPWNTVANAATEGVPIEKGWAVDAEGSETTDAKSAAALYPFGSYKGSGLGMMIDVLCALLSGAPFGPEIPKMYGDPAERRHLGGLVGAIDIGRFLPVEQFEARLADFVSLWQLVTPVESGGKVFYPGEPELIARGERIRSGIPVGLRLLDELDALADAFELRRLAPVDSAGGGEPSAPYFVQKQLSRQADTAP